MLDWLGSSVTTRATKQIKGVEFIDLILENVDKSITKRLLYINEELKEEEIKIYQEVKFNNDYFVPYLLFNTCLSATWNSINPFFDVEYNPRTELYSGIFRSLLFPIINILFIHLL